MKTSILLLAALLPLTGCAAAPATGVAQAPTATPPNDKAPTVQQLERLFRQLAPESAGKELSVRYSIVPETVSKQGPGGGIRDLPTGRLVGCATVNTREFAAQRAANGPSLGGGTLTVIFELETGRILHSGRSR